MPRKCLVRVFLKTIAVLEFLLCMMFCDQSAVALNPQNLISQYGHTAWRMQDGVFSSKPNSIAQTADGYIWLGTAEGLVRFDGVRFSPWEPPQDQKLPDSRIWALLAPKDGSLWIGTRTGLLHLVDGMLINYPEVQATVESIFQDDHGIIWITRSFVLPGDKRGPLCAVSGEGVHCYGASDGIPYRYAGDAVGDRSGNIWIAGTTLTKWRPGSVTHYNKPFNRSTADLTGVQALAAGLDGSIWVGMLQAGPGQGLQHLVNGAFSPAVVPGFDSSTFQVASLFTDLAGSLWVGTVTQGMYRIQGNTLSHFGAADGLSSDAVYNFLEDREGNLWTITSEGVDRFRNVPVATYSMREGLTADKADSVVVSRDGTIWVGNYYAVDMLRSNNFSSLGLKNGFPGTIVTAMFEDRDGRMWIGVDDKLAIVEHGRFHLFRSPAKSPIGTIFGIAQDTAGDLWVSNDKTHSGRLFRIQNTEVTEQTLPPKTQGVYSLAADAESGLWLGLRSGDLAHLKDGVVQVYAQPHVGAFDPLKAISAPSSGTVMAYSSAGFLVFRNGVSHRLTSRNGLPCDSVNSFITDLRGNLFLNSRCGILRISRDELERWWKAPASDVTFQQFGPLDGARTEPSINVPAAARSADGRLWFVNNRVLQVLDPDQLNKNVLPPPVAIEDVKENGKQYQSSEVVKFAHTRNLSRSTTRL